MHRSRIPNGRRGRVVSLLAAATMAAVPLALAGTASAAAPKNTAFTIGHGYKPALAVQSNGTAQVAWIDPGQPGAQRQLEYCRVPRGKRACTGLQGWAMPYGVPSTPTLLLPTPNTVLIVYYQYAGNSVTPPDQTYLLKSGDGGQTFAAPLLIGSHDNGGGAALGPNDSIYTVNDSSSYGISVQLDNLDGVNEPAEQVQATFSDEYGGQLAVLPSHGVLASHWDETDGVGTIHVSGFSGAGDPNATASWTTVVTQPGEDTQLANGPKGPYLFYAENAPDDPRFGVEKVGTVGPITPHFVTPKHQSNEQPTFWEDAAGRLNLAYWQDDFMFYRASDLKGWAATETLKAPGGDDERGATAADGGGFVAYDTDDITGKVTLVPIPVRRTVSAGISVEIKDNPTAGTKKSYFVAGFVKPPHAGQAVVLQVLVNKHWVATKVTHTTATGQYRFPVTVTGKTYRVVATEMEGYAEADSVKVKH
jgi:hypothetical protein